MYPPANTRHASVCTAARNDYYRITTECFANESTENFLVSDLTLARMAYKCDIGPELSGQP